MSDPLAGLRDALSGSYTIERELGRGGMATVYLATDLKHGREVAVKVLDPELASSGGGDRFLREIAIAARLKHPHILSLIDSGEAGGFYYFVMPYVEGESLRDRLERERQLPIEDAIEIAREVADGLGYAHRQGVVHRDIKPANVLLSEGHALIADFGVARALEEEGQGLTRTGMAVGTPQYMSPEQASGTEEVDGRTDLYALGCVLYEMLAGAPPLVGPTAQATAGLRLTETATSLPVLRDTVPGGLDRVTRKLLAKTPADRYPTAEKLAKALASPAVWSSAKRERRVGRRLIDAVIAVVLLALGGYATTWFAGRESEEIVPIVGEDLVPDLIAVIPFQVTDLDPRESTTIPGYIRALHLNWGIPDRVADPVEVEGLWGEVSSESDGDISRREAVDVGRDVKAWYTLIGDVRRTDDSVILSASLLYNHNGAEAASVQLTGSPDSLRELAQRAMIALRGQSSYWLDEEQSAVLARHDPKAVGLYFDALEADWDVAQELLGDALDIDSTFAMAALERYRNGERPGESDRIAWEFRDRMARKDRAIAEAFLAPFFDPPATAAEQLERWRHAWELDPNDDMTAAEYAQRVMIYNALLPQETARPGGLPWATLLLELLDRYCKTCPIWEQQEYTVVEAQARRGDADWIRAYFDRWDLWRTEAQDDDHVARPAYGSWLLAIAEGDEQSADETADKILEESRSAVAVDVGARVFPALSLPFVAVAAGRGLHGAEPIARWWREFPWSFLTERSSLFDRERGRHQEYRRTRDSLIAEERAKSNSWRGARQQVLEWAYYNEPESEETLDFLDSALTAQSREAEDAIDWATAACWRAQLRLHRGDAEGVFDTIRRLEEDPAYAPLAVSRTCAPFLRFLLARSHGGDVLPLALAVDSVASSVPIYGQWKNLIHNKLLRASNLVVARALREAGYVSDALASLRRRPDATGQGVVRGWIKNALGFTADYLREEGPLYAALGDTAMAIDRYEHYFRLRDERPDYEPWAAQWDSARAELEALRPPQ